MIIDGETYACESCVRGHRTRTCQHNDRPLQHIKAKGRPVSQCNHCRSERKNRSAHVKCQCGKRASEGGSGTKSSNIVLARGMGLTAHLDCGCFSGGKCKCATKKSPKQEPTQLGDISEGMSDLASPASTWITASPGPLPVNTDFQWSEGAIPASNFSSLDDLAQFDPNAWITSLPLDAAAAFGGSQLDQSALTTLPTTDAEMAHLPPEYHQPFATGMPDLANMADWPALDDEAAKEFLAMMDTSAGVDLNGFDAGTFHIEHGSHPDAPLGLEFSSVGEQLPPAQPATGASSGTKCSSKQDEGCGPCCG
ncbi:Copper fist DNA binding domain protein [Cordyceps militaris CM01]|uniref:Copper fist DNA binding domain protein n=1 Tax=Cordyceps militaris (strain CM01) TaxID=983644 RepID=G3J8L5_CORMM|nr:Copper fist DNA binding domain protein [Cordyceps militaris CM01]EGX94802.1 Copper fist DNA binding domain protein [Cordyceps militaris CM01]